MPKLRSICRNIRSKNAGPFWITVDLFFEDRHSFDRYAESPAIDCAAIGALFHVDPAMVKRFAIPDLNIVKLSFPRARPQGGKLERDMHGGQQYVRLLDIDVHPGASDPAAFETALAGCTLGDDPDRPGAAGVANSLHHEFTIEIDPDDIDFMGHVNNANYLKWVQAAVIDHWRRFAPEAALAAYQWIAVKHDITYRKPAYLSDALVAVVVLDRLQGARAFYSTVIKRGEETLADVRSSWCCIDPLTHRPVRLQEDIVEIFFGADAAGAP